MENYIVSSEITNYQCLLCCHMYPNFLKKSLYKVACCFYFDIHSITFIHNTSLSLVTKRHVRSYKKVRQV